MSAIDKVIQIAENEVGYLEKKDGSILYDKAANAGSGNFTKYWYEIMPEWNGQPWCACFVTWCFVKAFGIKTAKELLKHFPYVYCPDMAKLFKLHANPKRGDIVIFYRGGEFVHTGIVTAVDGDYFETIEGNTSGGTSIIANGGMVAKKHYYNSNLPGTKFCCPDWEIVDEEVNDVFGDINGHYAEKHIEELRKMGVVNGDNDGNFRPEDKVTRADAAIMVRNAIRYITGK